jgi:glycosyltransferase involved in cell wall biosynthesis
MGDQPLVRVIIPTYNRKANILRLLDNLRQQTLPPDQFEVLVMDDGSTYDPSDIIEQTYPFVVQYLRQKNQGATIARNNAARQSRGEVLVFMDDDVTISPPTLAALAETCQTQAQVIAMGSLIARTAEEEPSPFTRRMLEVANASPHASYSNGKDHELHFTWCNTELLAVQRSDFFALDMLQDPTGGWPNWDDVDFGYRAHQKGYRLIQSGKATGYHWDYSLGDLKAACKRWQRAGNSAVRLFQVYPDLKSVIPMLVDKTPIEWSKDSPRLILRKVLYRIVASKPVLSGMEYGVTILEQISPSGKLLAAFYRWIQGSYMLRGYQEGLQQTRLVQPGGNNISFRH